MTMPSLRVHHAHPRPGDLTFGGIDTNKFTGNLYPAMSPEKMGCVNESLIRRDAHRTMPTLQSANMDVAPATKSRS